MKIDLILRRRTQIYTATASLLIIIGITIADVLVVAGIFYQTGEWELIGWWHKSMWILASITSVALTLATQNLLPILIIFIPLTFQIEDILYMYIASTLNLQSWEWINPSYQWTWLEGSISYHIARMLGLETATTQTVLITSLIGTAIILTAIMIQITTLKLCIGKLCRIH